MRELSIALTIVLVVGLGCGTPPDKAVSRDKQPLTTVDGLIKVETDARGDLYLRKDHGIGGYDAIAIAPAFLTYRRTSAKLDPDDEDVYLVSLEQSLLDIAEAANVRIVDAAGECVIKIGAGFVNVDLARSGSAKMLGRMTLVIEYQDSMSGQSLLRYAAQESIEREAEGIGREQQIADSFDRMIEEVDMITTLRAATTVPSPPRAGCSGTLIDAGPSAAAD